MQLSKWKKSALWTLGVLGTLIMGALGSGLWELAVKPGGQWMAKMLLTAVTFGSMALKDEVYLQAAKGLHEEAALDVFFLLSHGR